MRKKPININISDYPELEGMDEDQIQEYILENGRDMKPIDNDVYENLFDELNNQEIEWENIENEDFNIIVE